MARIRAAQLTTPRLPRVTKGKAIPSYPMPRLKKFKTPSFSTNIPKPGARLDISPKVPFYMYPLEALNRIGHSAWTVASPQEGEDWQSMTGVKGIPKALGGLLKPSRWKQAGKSLIPFGETAGIYKQDKAFRSPYELIGGTVKSKLVQAGYDPEGKLARYAGGVAGFGGEMVFDPLMYLGAGAKSAVPKTWLGKGVNVLGAPARAMAKITGPASRLIRPLPVIGALGKPIRTISVVMAPFRGIAKGVDKLSYRSGVIGNTAKAFKSMGKWLRRNFTFLHRGGNIERGTIREMNSWAYSFEKGVNALDDPTYRSINAWAKSPKAIQTKGVKRFAAWLDRLGEGRARVAINEIRKKIGKNLNETMSKIVESQHMARAINAFDVSNDAKGLLLNMGAELRYTADRMERAIQIMEISKGDLDKGTLGELTAALTERGQKPLRAKDVLAATEGKAGIAGKLPLELSSGRVGYMPHYYDEAARAAMSKENLWSKWAGSLRKTIQANPKGLTPQQIDEMLNQTLEEIGNLKKTKGEWSRLPVSRHATADEINKAAWEAGLPKGQKLVSGETAAAFGKKGISRAKRIVYDTAVKDMIEVARQAPDLAEKNVQFSKFLNDDFVNKNSVTVSGIQELRQGKGALEGMSLLKDPATKAWHIIDDDLAGVFKNTKEFLDGAALKPELMNKIVGAYDWSLKRMKSLTLNYSPGYHIRNWIDDTVRMIVGEGIAITADGYAIATRLKSGGKLTVKFPNGVKTFDIADIDGLLAQEGKIGGFFRAELGKPVRDINYLRRGSQAIGEFSENFRAEALMSGLLNKYKNLPYEEAVSKAGQRVRDILFAYGEITPFERAVPARLMFFYRFFRKNLPFQIKALFENPFRQLVAMKAPSMLLGLPENEQDKYMPEWIRERGGFPIARRGNETIYTPGLGLSQFEAFAKLDPRQFKREYIGGLAPMLRVPLEYWKGKEIFIDRDITARNKVKSAAVANVLSLLNPIMRKLEGENLVHVSKNGKYWRVSGHVMWAIAQFRPLNDLRKFMEMVAPGKDQKGSWTDAIKWAASGQKTYKIDTEEAKFNAQRERFNELIQRAIGRGTASEINIPYFYKDLGGLTAKDEAQRELLQRQFRTLQRQSRARRYRQYAR